jgi:hypothetical protein
MVGPPSSTNSKPCSRSATPSSDSGHSTASELPVDPVTPPSASSPTATAWSDDDETPVLPRTRKLSELSLKSDSEHESGGNSKLQVLIKEAEDMIKSWEPNVWDDPTTEKLAPQDHVDIYEKLRVEPQPPVKTFITAMAPRNRGLTLLGRHPLCHPAIARSMGSTSPPTSLRSRQAPPPNAYLHLEHAETQLLPSPRKRL